MVVFGGSNLGDAWSLVWGNPVSVDTRVPGLLLGRPRPNPSRGETHVDFELGKPARVVIDVLDAQGRRVKRSADEWFAAGRHVRTWRGDDQDKKALESGIYFIRMQRDGFQATRRTVWIRCGKARRRVASLRRVATSSRTPLRR
jgi:hypothetical protein